MSPVWAVEIVEVLPDGQLLLEIHVISKREQLVKLVLVGSMGPLHFPVQLRRARLDVYVGKTFWTRTALR